MRARSLLSCLMLTALLLLMIVVVIPPSIQAAWSDGASLTGSPAEVFNGESVTFHFALTLAPVEGTTSVNITTVSAQFEWGAVNLFSGNEVVTSFPATLDYDAPAIVPGALAAGSHQVTLEVTATENDGAEPTTVALPYSFSSSDTALGVTASADVYTVNAPGTVSFTANAVGGIAPYTYAWAFGDGSTGSGATASHTYSSPGTYRAGVTVTDAYGLTASRETSDITVTPPFQVTISASPTSGQAPLTVAFTSSPSYGKAPYTYLWRFGDGGTSSEATPAYAYKLPGTYDAGLTITDSNGKVATSSTVRIAVSEAPDLRAGISVSATSGHSPLTVGFNSVVENATGAVEYDWSFGDGANSNEASPQHTYYEPGIYIVHLTVTDPLGRSVASEELEITVTSENGLLVSIAQGTSSGTAPLKVQFNSIVMNGTSPFFYRWDFGDGTTGAGMQPSHTYAAPGTYTVRLTVTDSDSRMVVSNELVVKVTAAQTKSDESSWDWTMVVMVGLIAAFLVAGIFLARPRK